MLRRGFRRPGGAPGRKRLKWPVKLLLFFSVLVLAAVFIDRQIRPLITTVAAYQAKVEATRIINTAITEELEKNQIHYGRLASLQTDKDGLVTSIETDIVNLNVLKARITNTINTELNRESERDLRIPLGTLVGGHFFSGRGPDIPFRILPAGYVHCTTADKFDSAGINQTRHQIMLVVETNISAIIPGYSVTTQVTTNFCVAETVIVGKVPGAFTEVTGDHSGLPAKINDYGARLGNQQITGTEEWGNGT